MFSRIQVIGRGRVGAAAAARLSERCTITDTAAELALLCVPDAAIPDVARRTPEGPWIAHVSGATPLAALDPHRRRFSVHPLQTFDRSGRAVQFDGAWGAVTSETPEARAAGRWLAGALGLQPFDLADADRVLYHAGAVMASNYLVTLFRAASHLAARSGAPRDALIPLMRRTIDNGFDLTGPIARGDWTTVERHLEALRRDAPEFEALYQVLAKATRP